MSVLVGTSDGYHIFTSSGDHHTALAGHSVDALAPGPDSTWVAIINRHEVHRHGADGTWTMLAASDVELSSLHTHRGVVLAGTYNARLLRLDDSSLVPVPAFDEMPDRANWHAVGPALNVRSMTSTCDGSALLANVHVGGMPRSSDDGVTWAPTIEVDDDVHEVRAHPSDPHLVFAAAAVGLCASRDRGATWSVETDGLADTYARAVAVADDEVLMSVSGGPWAETCAIYRRPIGGGPLLRVGDGLPERLAGNVDTKCLVTSRGQAALADGGGDIWASAEGSSAWHRLAAAVSDVRAVAIA